jgi:hypothetical protein
MIRGYGLSIWTYSQDMRDMMLHMLAKAPYPRWLNIKVNSK